MLGVGQTTLRQVRAVGATPNRLSEGFYGRPNLRANAEVAALNHQVEHTAQGKGAGVMPLLWGSTAPPEIA
jgi:hypothetical protein